MTFSSSFRGHGYLENEHGLLISRLYETENNPVVLETCGTLPMANQVV